MLSAPRYKNYYTLPKLKAKIKEIEDYIGRRVGADFNWNYTQGQGLSYVMEYYMYLKERYYQRLRKIEKDNKK